MGKPRGKPADNTSALPPTEDGGEGLSSSADAQGPAHEAPDKLDLILREIKDTRAALEQQIGTLATGLNLLKADHKKLSETVQDHDRSLKTMEPQIATHDTQIQQLQTQMTTLQERVEDAEGRNRRNNIRVIGLQERSEGTNAATFMEEWLREHVAGEDLSPYFCVERAHRIPTGRPKPGANPRPLILKILNYRDRDILLQKARDKGTILFENQRVSLYPDYTVAVQKQRFSFQLIKQKLRAAHLKYALLFPARLKIFYDKKTYFFTCPSEAEEWLEIMNIEGSQTGSTETQPQLFMATGKRVARGTQKTPQLRKSKGPSLSQQRRDMDDALQMANSFRHTSNMIASDTEESARCSDSDHSVALFPSATPQTAEDLLDN